MRKALIFCCLILSASLAAQSLEEQFRAFQQQTHQTYTSFRNQANLQYANFLRGVWQYYQQSPAIAPPEEVPVPPVVFDDDQPLDQDDHRLPIEVLPVPDVKPAPSPIAPIEENQQPQSTVQVIYQGTSFTFRVPLHTFSLRQTDGETLAKTWECVFDREYDNLLYDCIHNRDQHHLCDWAYIALTGALAGQLYGDSNEAALLHAYLLAQSGYAMRLAVASSGHLYVLVGSHYRIYHVKYYMVDGLCFYPLTELHEGVQICPGKFDREQPFSLLIDVDQYWQMQASTFAPRTSSKGVSAAGMVNLNTIAFYNTYPSGQVGDDSGTCWATYANAPMEECVQQSLYPALMQEVNGLPEEEAVNRLLNWVQTAFEYEYDDRVWGQERVFFPSETLHYPYSDCEDRAILFSRLVRDVLKLDVVLLSYPGHIATAVRMNQEVKGDYVVCDGIRYLVCDPTYIGAPAGRTMPGMDNHTARVIVLHKYCQSQ